MNFSYALDALRAGLVIQRSGWNGKNMYVQLVTADQAGVITRPFLALRTAQGELIPWTVSQDDVLATDWSELDRPAS